MKFANPVPSKNYQPHIDGLRALAIIPVFLYHLNASYCSGGFGGVDVFFVISGYLISLGIFKNLDRGTFSLLDFYDKRIRRIIPIYTFTILAVLLIAPFILYPEKLYDLAKMAVSGTFFVANIDLYLSQSYWTQGNMPSPLTNLWSLSVEEQFYVFLPLLLMFTYKFAKKYLLLVLGLVFVASFGLILYHFYTELLKDFAFYMLPLRMNELLMGSFLAYFTLKNKDKAEERNKSFDKLIAFVALASLVIVYYTLNHSYLFPSLWAILLCAISVILIKYGNAGITGHILRSRPFVFIGRISYSVYLIHYPLIAFCNFIRYDRLSISEEILITLATLLISTLTWAYIELPIRISKTWTREKSFILFIGTSLSIVLVASSYFITSGFTKYIAINPYKEVGTIQLEPKTHFDDAYDSKEYFKSKGQITIYKWNNSDKPADILLMGDSHLQTLVPILKEEYPDKNFNAEYLRNWIPVSEYNNFNKGKAPVFPTIIDYLKQNSNIESILIIHRWTDFYHDSDDSMQDRELGFIKFVKELNNIGIKVFITSTVPQPRINIGEYAYKKHCFTPRYEIRASKEEYLKENAEINKAFNYLEKERIAKVIRIESLFEDGDFYKVEDYNLNPLYFNINHLSLYGSRIVAPYLVEEFLKMRKKQ